MPKANSVCVVSGQDSESWANVKISAGIKGIVGVTAQFLAVNVIPFYQRIFVETTREQSAFGANH